jgi:hypothetical protein
MIYSDLLKKYSSVICYITAQPRDIRRGENSRGMKVKAPDIQNKCMANMVHATSIG